MDLYSALGPKIERRLKCKIGRNYHNKFDRHTYISNTRGVTKKTQKVPSPEFDKVMRGYVIILQGNCC